MADEKSSSSELPVESDASAEERIEVKRSSAEPKPEPAATESVPEARSQEQEPTEPEAAEEPETSADAEAPDESEKPAESEQSQESAESETPEHTAVVMPGPKHRLHISKKFAIIGLCVIMLLGGAGATYRFVIYKPKPVSLFSKKVLQPFKVVSSAPLPEEENVASDTKITLTFNRPVDPDNMKGDFYVSPQTDGTFSQGKTAEQVVFTPNIPFDKGSKYQFMLHGEFTAKDGSKLGADYFGKFTTATPDDGFYFVRQDEYLDLDSMPSGTDATYTISAGNDIKSGTTVTVYKSDVDQLLRSFIYKDQTDDQGDTWQELASSTVSTTGLSVVTTKTGVNNGGTFEFSPSTGVYLAVATNGGQQVGRMWIVASDYGALLRQDDQNAVVALQKLDGSGSANGSVDFYSLKGGMTKLATKQISGQATVGLGFKPRLDIVVAHVGGQVQIVPVGELDSLADLRSMVNLSVKPTAFGTTDKPSYQPGETVRFAGYLRTDNDATYDAYSGSTANLYVASYPGGPHLADLTVPVSGDGTFKGSFVAKSSFITDGSKSQVHIYVQGDNQQILDYGQIDADVASFTTTKEAAGQFALKVSLPKSSYLPTDKITASIVGVKADGTPLANTTVNVDTFAAQYEEGDVSQNSYVGDKVNKSPVTVQLDAQGRGSYTVDVSKLPAGSSQTVTVEASKKESSGAKVAGSAQAVVHQGDAILEFGPSRTVVQPDGTLVARVYAKKLNGADLPNASISYKIESSSYNDNTQQYDTKQLATGSVTADASGYVTINQKLSNAPLGSATLTVTTGDSHNNKVQSQQYYYIDDGKNNTVYSDVQLNGLDVYGSETDVNVGETLHLTVEAPQPVHALMSLERDRVHLSKVLDLHEGKNSLTLPITPDLLPSFNLVFSYFSGGKYHVDGVEFTVNSANKLASANFNIAGLSIQANKSFKLPLSVTDTHGNGVATRVIFSASESSMFDIASPLTSPIYSYLWSPRERTTNSSSSLTAIGTGGGKCGDGGDELPDYVLPSGKVASWQPDLSTDSNGQAKIPLNLPKGTWHLTAYVMSKDNIVGSTSTDITVK